MSEKILYDVGIYENLSVIYFRIANSRLLLKNSQRCF